SAFAKSDGVRLHVCVIAVLIVAVVDDDKVASGSVYVWSSGSVFRKRSLNEDDGAVLRRKHLFAIGVVVRVARSIPLIAFPVGANLDKVVRKRFGEEFLMGVQISMFILDVPRAFKG